MSQPFQGTIYFVQVAFTVQGSPSQTFVVSTADMQTAIDYASRAITPISLYAAQYGPNSVTIHPQEITYKFNTLAGPTIDDTQLQQIVKDVASRLPRDACVLVLLPPQIDNTTHSRSMGDGGYHGFADVPYINSYISNDREGSTSLTVEDRTFRYAGALSHEIAEMIVDPAVDGHPEVCDPCGPNFVSTYLPYFDGEGNYITTTQRPPYDPNLGFTYAFYVNAIVQPPFAKPQAAPGSACVYAPVPVGVSTVRTLADPLCCDAFFSPDDGYRHAIVGQSGGEVDEVFFHPELGQGVARVASVAGLVDLGAFYTPDDDYRRVLTAAINGDITEWFFHPAKGSGSSAIANIPSAQRVCGFYSADDGYRHAIVSTAGGEVFEVFYHPSHGGGTARLGAFGGVVDIGAFYSDDDQRRHVIVGARNGDLTEIFYHPSAGQGQVVVAQVRGLARVSAYYVENDLYDRRVQAGTAAGELVEVRYNPRAVTLRVRLAVPGLMRDVGGFYSSDDAARHAVCLLTSGDVKEVFFYI